LLPGISLFVKCKDQVEVDLYWNKFIAGRGREANCGWLQDKWGVSWQIIPHALGRYLGDPERELRPPSSHKPKTKGNLP
jgi:predicted 3-demethylubiquinone-9 3-methyltransferase (glyoxalase superfamily)